MRRSRRLVAAVSTLALVPGLVALQAVGQPPAERPSTRAEASLLHPADGYRAPDHVTSHGIPHIVAKDYQSSGTARAT